MSNIDSLVLNVKKYFNILNIKVPSTPPVIPTTPGEKYINDKLSLCNKYIELYKNNQVITCINNIQNNRIISIGDIHGDIELMLNTLLISKVIQKKPSKEINNIELNNKGEIEYYEWIGGDTIVVQVGDQIDRCRPGPNFFNTCDKIGVTIEDEASDIEILLFFTQLHELAITKGGAVYSLLGNHELMNAEGDVRYVSLENLKLAHKESNADIKEGWIELFKRGGTLSLFLAYTRSTILIINNHLFVHAGIINNIINNIDTSNKCEIFEIINEVIKKWLMYDNLELNANQVNEDNFNTEAYNNNIYKKIFNQTDENQIDINQFIFSIDSPFYTRKLGNIKPDLNKNDPSCEDVNFLIHTLKLKGIIVGHTPQTDTFIENGKNVKIGNINGTCDNKLYRVDIASSKAFYYILNNNIIYPQVLEIQVLKTGDKVNIIQN